MTYYIISYCIMICYIILCYTDCAGPADAPEINKITTHKQTQINNKQNNTLNKETTRINIVST